MNRKVKKPLLWENYIQLQKDYQEKYGDKTIVFMQVGSFYEIYSITDSGYIREVCEIMGIIISRKNLGEINPYMAGVPDWGVKKFIDKLIDENYTVVIVDQIGQKNINGEYEKREVSKILSKANIDIFYDINQNGETNNLMAIYLENEKTLQGKVVSSIGISVLDITTGKNTVIEFNSLQYNILEELYHLIETFNPCEIVLHLEKIDPEDFRIDFGRRKIHKNFYAGENKKELFKISYQTEFLRKIFPKTGMLNPIEYLNLRTTLYALNSYVVLLQFAYEHVFGILEKISIPQHYFLDKYLNIYNNAIYQLDVIPNKMRYLTNNVKYDSLFSVLNMTSTPIGRRELRDRLLNPIINCEILNERYNLVDKMIINKDLVEKFEEILRDILDIEKYHRKLAVKLISPIVFANLDKTYSAILKLFDLFNGNFSFSDLTREMIITSADFDNFKEFYGEYRKNFKIEVMITTELGDVMKSFFMPNLYPDIDLIDNKIEQKMNYLRDIEVRLSNEIGEVDGIKLIYQDKKGNKRREMKEGSYFYTGTKRRVGILKTKKIKNELGLIFEAHTNSEEKISSAEIDKCSRELIELYNALTSKTNEKYMQLIEYFGETYNFEKIIKFIGIVDVIKSIGKTAISYNYCRPQIVVGVGGGVGGVEEDKSYIIAKEMRHPIVERLALNTNYIPNDIKLGCPEEQGILLFGINGVGKSTEMKSVGLNIIMAQAGFYVAAKEFVYYPYHHIFTRISGDDNLFHGQSSFAIEMSELRSILRYANDRSLVLGDEVCRGTETVSGISIVASSLKKFTEQKVSFIFATHLHQLSQMEIIRSLTGLKIYHLSVDFSEDGSKIIYNRKLKDGAGECIYGLEVAKCLLGDKEFMMDAYRIRNELLGISEYLVEPKKSVYNSELYVNECQICGEKENLDVHHILFQSNCNENGLIGHIRKNVKSNLVVLCSKHHIEVHCGDLEIIGYKETTEGVVIEYRYLEEKGEIEDKKNKKLKYGEEEVKMIQEYLNNYGGGGLNFVIQKLRDEKNIRIGKATLMKIQKNQYLVKVI